MKFDLNGSKAEDGEQALDSDEEHDAEWRKMRMEREAFLEKHSVRFKLEYILVMKLLKLLFL